MQYVDDVGSLCDDDRMIFLILWFKDWKVSWQSGILYVQGKLRMSKDYSKKKNSLRMLTARQITVLI